MIIAPSTLKTRTHRSTLRLPILIAYNNQIRITKSASGFLNDGDAIVFEQVNESFFALVKESDARDAFVVRQDQYGGLVINSRELAKELKAVFKMERPRFKMEPKGNGIIELKLL